MKRLIIIILIFIPLLVQASQENAFDKANALYKESNFQGALDEYLALEKKGEESGDLYYNIANSYYRLGKTGSATLYYEKAKLLMPRDPDIEYNANFVKKLTKDAVETDASADILFWNQYLSFSEIIWIFIIINILFFTVLSLRIFVKTEWSFYLALVSLAVCLFFGISLAGKYYTLSTDDRAVIIAEEADVLSGPDSSETVLFKLHAGTIVRCERTEDAWKLIKISDDKRGWLGNDSVRLILE